MRFLIQLWKFGASLDILIRLSERRVVVWFGLHGWFSRFHAEVEFCKQDFGRQHFYIQLPWIHLNNTMLQRVVEELPSEVGGTEITVKPLISGKIFGKVIGGR